MATLEVNGADLEVDLCGEGRSVVLVHGSASDHRTWHAQREAWCGTFRLVTYGRRYHWPNEPIASGGTYSLAEQVGDLEQLLLKLDARPASLIGHSYGGLVALLAAARSPDLVDALVLVEPPVMGLFVNIPPTPFQLLKLALRRPRTAMGIAKLGTMALGPATAALERGEDEEAMRRMGIGILGAEAFRALDAPRLAQIRDNLIAEELQSPEALPRLDLDEVRSVRCPVLLVGGDRSPAVFSRLLDRLEELLPTTERMTIRDASHIAHEDNPTMFNRAVESFLERHERPVPPRG